MDGLDEDLVGNAPAEGDGRVRGAVADEERPAKDGLAVELYDVALLESQGHKAAADVLAAGEIDDSQGLSVRGVEQVHGVAGKPVYPILYMNQGKFSSLGHKPY